MKVCSVERLRHIQRHKRVHGGFLALCIFVIICFAVTSSEAAKVYRWTDDSGVVNLSDSPPTPAASRNAKVEVFNFRGAAAGQAIEDTSAGGTHVIPFTATPQGYQVDVIFNDNVRAKMILDTGATLVVISDRLLSRIGQKPLEGMPPLKFVTANGEIEAKSSVMKKIRMGSAVREDVPVAVIHEGVMFENCDGLLGLSFLSGFHLSIDNKAGTITLKKD